MCSSTHRCHGSRISPHSAASSVNSCAADDTPPGGNDHSRGRWSPCGETPPPLGALAGDLVKAVIGPYRFAALPHAVEAEQPRPPFPQGHQRPADLRQRLVVLGGIGPRERPLVLRSEEHTSELQSRQYLVC